MWEYSTEATVLAEGLAANEILENYNSQLDDEGWTYKESLMEAAFSWSSWSFTDEDGNPFDGFLYVVRDANDAERFFVTLQMTRKVDR